MPGEIVIVDSSFGDIRVYPATLDNAIEIWNDAKTLVNKEIVELYNKKDVKYITKETISTILELILSKEVGYFINNYITVTAEYKSEVILYMHKLNIPIDNNQLSNKFDLFNQFKFKDLSFFNREEYLKFEIIDNYKQAQLRKYRTIEDGKWKEDATELAKIKYILDFVIEISHRDTHYEVVKVREKP